MGLFHFNEDRKHYCGTYKGFKVWQYGCMIGSNWYGDFYITIPRGGIKTRDESQGKRLQISGCS